MKQDEFRNLKIEIQLQAKKGVDLKKQREEYESFQSDIICSTMVFKKNE